MVKVLIADKNYLTRVGMELLVDELKGFELVPTVCGDLQGLENQLQLSKPNLLITDFLSLGVSIKDLKYLVQKYNRTRFLVITEILSKAEFKKVLDSGVNSYLTKDCDKSEILEAVNSSIKGENYVCSKILSILTSAPEIKENPSMIKSIGCHGIAVTGREIEIIVAIAEGLSNKLIADKLSLSTHTVNTHRKNIMNKLGVNNTAGVVMFAVKNKLLETDFELFNEN